MKNKDLLKSTKRATSQGTFSFQGRLTWKSNMYIFFPSLSAIGGSDGVSRCVPETLVTEISAFSSAK